MATLEPPPESGSVLDVASPPDGITTPPSSVNRSLPFPAEQPADQPITPARASDPTSSTSKREILFILYERCRPRVVAIAER
jgi:hypothetical protein